MSFQRKERTPMDRSERRFFMAASQIHSLDGLVPSRSDVAYVNQSYYGVMCPKCALYRRISNAESDLPDHVYAMSIMCTIS